MDARGGDPAGLLVRGHASWRLAPSPRRSPSGRRRARRSTTSTTTTPRSRRSIPREGPCEPAAHREPAMAARRSGRCAGRRGDGPRDVEWDPQRGAATGNAPRARVHVTPAAQQRALGRGVRRRLRRRARHPARSDRRAVGLADARRVCRRGDRSATFPCCSARPRRPRSSPSLRSRRSAQPPAPARQDPVAILAEAAPRQARLTATSQRGVSSFCWRSCSSRCSTRNDNAVSRPPPFHASMSCR